jgi:hypothetical protein
MNKTATSEKSGVVYKAEPLYGSCDLWTSIGLHHSGDSEKISCILEFLFTTFALSALPFEGYT